MITAIDTNVLVVLFSSDSRSSQIASEALYIAAQNGPLVLSPVIYAELLAGREAAMIDRFLAETRIDVDWDLPIRVWHVAGERYRDYAENRRRQRGDPGPRRILADFMIGAHAATLANALLTSDARVYRTYFPELHVISL